MSLDEGIPLGPDDEEISDEPEKISAEEEARRALPPDPSPERVIKEPLEAPVRRQVAQDDR